MIEHVKDAIRNPYAWPGGYEKFGICDDGGILCHGCMQSEFRNICHSVMHDIHDGWNVVGIDAECNHDGPLHCDHCNKSIIKEES